MEKENQLVKNLASLNCQVLADFIASLYGEDDFLDSRIERLVLSSDSDALAKLLKKEIASLKRSKSYIDYYESSGFAHEINEISMGIENDVLPVLPDQAFKLVDGLLNTAGHSLERCDDSDGYIGDVYRKICLLWLKAASLSSAPRSGWVQTVRKLADNNDYGVLDLLLPNADILLSEDELSQLAAYYEEGLRTSLEKKEKDEFGTNHWSVNLHGIAEALKDPEMYQRCTLLVSPSPNYLQIADMVGFFMRCEEYVLAIKWLENEWKNTGWDKPNAQRLSLLEECYLALNQHEKRRETLILLLDISPTYHNLQKTLPLVSAGEAQQLRVNFIASVLKQSDIYEKLSPLLQLEEYALAESVALAEFETLQACSYTTLLSLLKISPDDLSLVRIILLRCLLGDILHRAKTQAYHHAADYLKELDQLDKRVTSYKALPNHADYMLKVKEKHGRKYSFWSKYNT